MVTWAEGDPNTGWQEHHNVGPAETYFILHVHQTVKTILGNPILDYRKKYLTYQLLLYDAYYITIYYYLLTDQKNKSQILEFIN